MSECCSPGPLSFLSTKQEFRVSITPLRHSLKPPPLGSNVHHQLVKTFWVPYFTPWDSHARQTSSLKSSSTISPPRYRFYGSTDSPGLENRPSRRQSHSGVKTKVLSEPASSAHDLATAATCSSYSQPLLFSFPISAAPFGMHWYWQSRKTRISAATVLRVSSKSLLSSHFEPRNRRISLSCARS